MQTNLFKLYFRQIRLYLKSPIDIFNNWAAKGRLNWMPDKWYISLMFRSKMGYWMDWKHPKTYVEKLNWLKVYNRNPLYHKLVDKYEVKKYVSDIIGSEYIAKCYAIWENLEHLDFSSLPNQFVIKATNDSGSFFIVKDKKKASIQAIKEHLLSTRHPDYYLPFREWAYKGVKNRYIAEEYIPSLGQKNSVEYKLTCFNGKVVVITVCKGIAHSDPKLRTNNHFDKEWNHLNGRIVYQPSKENIEKPKEMDLIVALSEKLSQNIPNVRVDWYVHEGRIYFGEMTFYTWAGFRPIEPREADIKLGEKLSLP